MIRLTISSGGIATAVERPLDEDDLVVLDQVGHLGELLGPEHGAAVEPLRSSKVNLAIRVSPDRLFWTFFTATLTIMPPRMTSALSGAAARSATRWVASAASRSAWRARGWLDM